MTKSPRQQNFFVKMNMSSEMDKSQASTRHFPPHSKDVKNMAARSPPRVVRDVDQVSQKL